MDRWSHLARYALITVWEADHPRSLAHPQNNHCGQHLHTHSIEHYFISACFQGLMWVWKFVVQRKHSTYLSNSDTY